ncbi:MAG TPA: aromatic-ring-hydroxylating dioxygenase subunit beta [Chloroflexota bacterium]|jgi:3-phenylpropionate/cinnamic acid dioxygenase small subunit
MAGPGLSVELRLAVADFLAREAELLDARQFTAWLALFADDARYAVYLREPPRPPTVRDPSGCEDPASAPGAQTPSPNPLPPQGAGASGAGATGRPPLPSPREGEGGPGGVGVHSSLLFDDDKSFLALRVRRLESRLAHAERPPSVTRRVVANLIVEPAVGSAVDVRASFVVYQARAGLADQLFFGKRHDRLRQIDGEWRIARRTVVLDHNPLPRTLTIFF